jgi:hypothetical protein
LVILKDLSSSGIVFEITVTDEGDRLPVRELSQCPRPQITPISPEHRDNSSIRKEEANSEDKIMLPRYRTNTAQFVKVVYSKVQVNGKLELVPMELYSDGSLKRSA